MGRRLCENRWWSDWPTVNEYELSDRLLAELPHVQQARWARSPGWPEDLPSLFDGARQAWPSLYLDPLVFLAYLASRVPEDMEFSRISSHMQLGEVYLTCACRENVHGAVDLFEATYGESINSALRPLNLAPDNFAEVRQSLRHRLFLGGESSGPAIDKYSGVGSLRAWVCVVAVREAIALFRQQDRQKTMDERALVDMPALEADPELAHMKSIYREEFRTAFSSAMASLGAKDRTLLRQTYIDGLTIDQLGQIYRVHRSTAARRVERVRDILLAATQEHLMNQLSLSQEDVESMIRLINSQIDISIHSFLVSPPGATEP
jgi:RNA polymerase sigma-70 factor (ECF subfamily)